MCQFLQHQIWHQESQSTIEGLTKTSSKVVDTLKSSSKLQDDIIKNQLETLQYQKEIAAHGSVLNQTVEVLYVVIFYTFDENCCFVVFFHE